MRMKRERENLVKKKKELHSRANKLDQVYRKGTPLMQFLLNCEIRKNSGVKRATYSDKEKAIALNWMKVSNKQYRYFSKFGTKIPSSATLSRVIADISLGIGMTDGMLEYLKSEAESQCHNPRNNLVTLVFDEIQLNTTVQYNARLGRMEGLIDYGTEGGRKPELATHGLLFMVQGVCRKFRHSLGYYLTKAVVADDLKAMILKMVESLTCAGFTVVATVCDMAASNVRALKSLMENADDGFFMHNDKRVYVIYDVPHLTKTVRNNLAAYNFQFYQNGQTKTAKWQHIVDLYNDSQKRNLNLVPKLRQYDRKINR